MKINDKINNCKFSNNLFKALIAPIMVLVLAIVFAFTIGFNKSIDFTGGMMVSVVAGTDVKLDEKTTYNEFKTTVDNVLKSNNVKGQIYSVEVNELQEYTLVVKFAYSGNDEQKENLIVHLKEDLIQEFYASTSIEDIENNSLIIVAPFGSSVDSSVLLTTILATIIATIIMCAYIAIRMGMNAGILSLVNAILNNIFAFALIMVARVPLTYVTFIAIPFVTIVSIVSSFIYFKKTKDLLFSTENYTKKSNFVLADDAVKQTFDKQVMLAGISAICLLLIGFANLFNTVLFVAISLFTCVATVLYTNILVLPGLFARTYVRKAKKEKQNEAVKKEDKLTEEQVMNETDLDNLVSN